MVKDLQFEEGKKLWKRFIRNMTPESFLRYITNHDMPYSDEEITKSISNYAQKLLYIKQKNPVPTNLPELLLYYGRRKLNFEAKIEQIHQSFPELQYISKLHASIYPGKNQPRIYLPLAVLQTKISKIREFAIFIVPEE
jgi:hypothetical protein